MTQREPRVVAFTHRGGLAHGSGLCNDRGTTYRRLPGAPESETRTRRGRVRQEPVAISQAAAANHRHPLLATNPSGFGGPGRTRSHSAHGSDSDDPASSAAAVRSRGRKALSGENKMNTVGSNSARRMALESASLLVFSASHCRDGRHLRRRRSRRRPPPISPSGPFPRHCRPDSPGTAARRTPRPAATAGSHRPARPRKT